MTFFRQPGHTRQHQVARPIDRYRYNLRKTSTYGLFFILLAGAVASGMISGLCTTIWPTSCDAGSALWIRGIGHAHAADDQSTVPIRPGGNATEMTDIHDIKPALRMAPDLAWLLWAVAAVVCAILLYLGWQWWQRKRKTTSEPPAPPVPAETEAFQALDRLAADGIHRKTVCHTGCGDDIGRVDSQN